ncbi:hypothetical protein F4775DRAFT_431811 [Biscogniauxia sp. FL1348]|nr:hypothetical protein F4775DRAFT_431811 [Biscogniauxia sp. FL1348]
MEQPSVEILVHIAAPSKTVDDARYRSLASAYIDFEPVTHLSFHDHDDHQTPRPSGPLGSLKSPYASFRSVIDNANSPLLRLGNRQVSVEATPLQPTTQSTQSSWQSPPSIVEDSQHAIPLAAVSSPTRVLEHYLQSFADSSQSHVRSSNESGPVVISNTPAGPSDVRLQTRYQTGQYPSTPSVPNTPLGEKIAEAPDHQGEGSQERNHNETNRKLPSVDGLEDHDNVESSVLMNPPGAHPIARADSEPTPGQRPGGQALVRAASDLGPRASTPSSQGQQHPRQMPLPRIDLLPHHGFQYESLVLTGPEPPLSVADIGPADLVTRDLADLARNLGLGRDRGRGSRYQPQFEARALRPLERGYWLVDCSTWSARLKRDAWAYLANYVGTGVAGWGVSCRRDPEFARLRVYCWGVVVPHLYFLLYLASQREILFTGCQWIDGGGESVVVMGAREYR